MNAAQITASAFINDDEYGLHQDYEEWLEELPPHAPISQYEHNRTGEACPERSEGPVPVLAGQARDRNEGTMPTPT